MATGQTNTLHLSLGPDTDVNRNWQILDAAMTRLSRGTIIPDDVLIQGDLEVGGNATINGALVAGSIDTGLLTAGTATITGGLEVGGTLSANGPVNFQPGSISGLALAPDAAVVTAQVGATGAQRTITPVGTPIELCTLTLPAATAGHWLLLIAQLSAHFFTPNLSGGQGFVDFTLRADTTPVQMRSLQQVVTTDIDLNVPLTMIWLNHALLPAAWSVWATAQALTGSMQITVNHSVIGAIQLR